MNCTLAQLLILCSSAALPPEPKKITATESIYRPRCSDCDEEGRDARLPCEGHN